MPPPSDPRDVSRACRDTEDCHLLDSHSVPARAAADLAPTTPGCSRPRSSPTSCATPTSC
jgi:hypothetical protein